jgi:hypothetical protein
MNRRGIRNISTGRFLAGCVALLFLTYPALRADKKSAPAPAPKAAPAKPASGGSSAAHPSGASTASHGPTTASHGPTTASHGPTTASHGPTTASHGATTSSAGHTTTTGSAGKGATGSTAGKGTTGSTAGKGTTGSTAGKGGTGSTAGKGGTGSTAGKGGAGSMGAKDARGAPAAKGQKTVATKNGAVTKRADGKIATVHDTKRGMDVHRNLSGNRRVVVERSDHSRIVADRRGGYVQRRYDFHGHEYARRSGFYRGRYYNRYYGRYYYHGLYVNPYFPSYYYGAAFYGWAYNPWAAPIAYGWGWGGNPWFGYYGAFFTPFPVYAGPSFWLTDYLIANSLQAAYQAQAAALADPAPLSPDVKNLIADEVKQQIALENTESQAATAPNGEPDAASSSIARLLTDGKQHVFVAGTDIDVVDAGGTECALSEGDPIQLTGTTAPDAQAATLAVLASKGGKECPKGDTVSVNLSDLQDMQNHMRETIDQGMQELQKKQGSGGLPAAPSSAKAAPVESPMAAIAPPPPPESEVKGELQGESQEADKAEKEAAADAGSSGGPNAETPSAEPANIELGQTIDQVQATLGNPVRVVNLGPKKIYVYKDMKITFKDGKVADVQ